MTSFAFLLASLLPAQSDADVLPIVTAVERQPLVSATKRLVEALDYVGAPLSKTDAAAIQQAMKAEDDQQAIRGIQKVLDKYCLAGVNINAESRVKVQEGAAKKVLANQAWSTFLVKVHNEAGINPKLVANSPNAAPIYMQGRGARQKPMTDDKLVTPAQVKNRFLDLRMYDRQPLKPTLSGLSLEYRIIQIATRVTGKREAELSFNVGQGTQDIGFRNSVPILFSCEPSVTVKLDVRDFDNEPVMAGFVIRDRFGRVYPNPAQRLAPDFFFHNQVYRESGESLQLPPGDYTAEVTRGPEYFPLRTSFTVNNDSDKTTKNKTKEQTESFQLKRWIHPAKRNWFSGDHHVHAAGCAHYDSPTEGVGPDDMMRHILGEDLNVGCVLSWGPCWYTQKQFFEGQISKLSTPDYLMRYDVEVSGFPSSHAGHLCLLRLTEDDFPGTTKIEEWPSWTLPVLKWGKEQGGVVGYSHSGWGLALPDYMPDGSRKFTGRPWGGPPNNWNGRDAKTLPDYAMPPFDGIGANEFIVTVAHDVCHFISAVDTPAIWELNIWYHTLNCGMRARISGETDFPCIYGDKVGLGRIYVKLDPGTELTFDNWIQGVRDGRSYCGDGLSHILDFKVNDLGVGEKNAAGAISELSLDKPGKVTVTFDAAAMLEENPSPLSKSIRNRRLDQKPYWHVERARIGETRKVPVELIVNGEVAAKRDMKADGSVQEMSFDVNIEKSSWVAVRILPTVHTNPVFVTVGEKPIRANRRSAQWCIDAVDTCWKKKEPMIRASEKVAAKKAYDEARAIYEKILAETDK